MSGQPSQLVPTDVCCRGARFWFGSLGFSTLVHVSLVLLLASLWRTTVSEHGDATVESRWSEQEPAIVVTAVPHAQSVDAPDNHDSAGPISEKTFVAPTPAAKPSVGRLFAASAPPEQWLSDSLRGDDPAEHVGAPAGAAGTGQFGTGHNNGRNEDLFAAHSAGQSVVFVVDGSRSMNHPHPSPAKTRFGKVKLELVKSIIKMDASMRFFVIFFNETAVPMPTRELQPASRAARSRYLQWIAQVETDGFRTDPRDAILRALALNPDVIYFLTDGEFDVPVRIDLGKLRQTETVIHTIAFSNDDSEKLLKLVAEANSGSYRFVP